MASEYPMLSKCFDAKWFKKHMKCPKKVAFDYVGSNKRFVNFFGKEEKALQDLIDEVERNLTEFLENNLSETAKAKIESMAKIAKKESDEKKAKKNAEKYGMKISTKKEEAEKLPDEKLVRESKEENEEGRVMKKAIISTAADPLITENLIDISKDILSVDPTKKKDLSLSTDASDHKFTEFTDDPSLAPTPKKKDLSHTHKKLLMFSKANLFVVSKDGKKLSNEINFNEEKSQIQVSIVE